MLYHLARAADWDAAQAAGEYRLSTVGRSLEAEGFVHACFAAQVPGVADRYYATIDEPLVLLHVDEARLTAPWRVDVASGAAEGFPHVYGPIAVAAVIAATPVRRGPDGRWSGLPDAGDRPRPSRQSAGREVPEGGLRGGVHT